MPGSRVRKSNVNIGSASETMIVIEKMSAGEIEAANGTGVLRSSPGHHDQTLIETGTIEIGEIGNAPIVRDRIVSDPIASGRPAHLDRQHRAIALATVGTGKIGRALIAEVPIVSRSPARPDRT
ncbi:MAG TPA: hypothetical protein VM574_08630 [Terrimicrobiaceae bacterium]|nr:hypothetical protein [Terrimicrobiaceae bacterium]